VTSGDFLAFLAASIVFIAIPGPNVALICAQSLTYGLRFGLLTVAGVAAAMAIQLTVVVLGLGTLATRFAGPFETLRWLGVIYLLYLGVRSWTEVEKSAATHPPAGLGRTMLIRGFAVSLTNVQTFLFFAAFLPQFVDPTDEPLPQLAFLAAMFLALGILLDGVWALIAARLRFAVSARGRWRSRTTGALLMAGAFALALTRVA
jgi:threonine/homoserine/homoserine lactone efflux protein